MRKIVKNPTFFISALAVIAMLLASCSPSGVSAGSGTATTAPTSASTSQPSSQTGTTATSPASTATSSVPTGTSSAPTGTAVSPTAGPTPVVKNPNTLVEATISQPSSMDPAWEYDTASADVLINVYETLVFPKKSSPTDMVPMLATSWDTSSDGLTWTFHIRSGVKFQNGDTLTPEDVAYSFWRGMIQDRAGGPQWIMLEPFFGLNVQSFQNDVVQALFNGNFANAAQAVENAVTYDNSAMTVTLHLKQPYGPMLEILSGSWASVIDMNWAISQGAWDGNPGDAQKYHDPAANQDALYQVANGTGPYSMTKWIQNQEVDLTANPNYWSTTPLWPGGPSGVAKVKNVIIQDVPEFGTRFAMLKTGDADIAYIDTQYYSQVDPLVAQTCDQNGTCTPTNNNGASLTLFKGLPSVQMDAIFMNQNINTTGGNSMIGSGKLDGNGIPANFFSDINVRKAFNYCFDWQTYITQVWNGEAIQAYGPIIQGELGYNANQGHYTFDLTKCADAFKASTLTSPSGASLWDTGFTMEYIYNTGNAQRKTAGDILAADLAKVNPKFKLQVVAEPFDLMLKDQVSGTMPIFMLGWLEDYHDPSDWVAPFLSSGGAYAAYLGFPSSLTSQMDPIITQAATTTDQTQRASLYGQLQNLAYENALYIFVEQPLLREYMQSWITGYYYNPIWGNTIHYFYAYSK